MNIEIILTRPSGTLKLLGSPEATTLMDFMKTWANSCYKVLESKGSSLDEVRFAQGQLSVLKRLLGLKDEITKYQNEKLRGKVNEVSHGVV